MVTPMSLSLPKSIITPGRCIVFLICLSLTIVLSMPSSRSEVEPPAYRDAQFVPRQNNPSSIVPSIVVDSKTSTSTTTSRETQTSQSSNPTPTNPSTTSSTSESTSPPKQESTSTTPPPQSSTSPPPLQLSSVQSTGADGSPTVVIVTVQASNSNTGPTPSPTTKDSGENDSSSGLGTGSIIGLSVAGGIALLGVMAFFIWKFTRKRRGSGYDDGEIKWPDLNSESHMPGQEDHAAPQSISEHASIRGQSFQGGYGDGGLGASHSQVDLYATDPYAVPPLPHLNPNQPYRDDPNPGTYNDNFNPPAFQESRPSSPSIRGEAIPMNQINRSRSPGPQGALLTGYGGRQSPGPQAGVMGRQSPGPQDAYGGGYGRRSPGPNEAYGPR